MSDAPAPSPKERPLSLGVIFLTLYIDLVGFSIIFPFGPDLVEYYLRIDGRGGLLGWLLARSADAAHALGRDQAFAAVLFGGIVTAFFSILQFVFSPLWGSLSDRRGRRPVLLTTVAGTGLGYLVWALSGSFWIFLLSRLVSGAFSGNLSVATAAVADVTTRQERSRAMGIVGAAFGLGLVTGPGLGALTASLDLLHRHPSLARFGVNPFSVPALISLGLCLLNLLWIGRRFRETLTPAARAEAPARVRNPVSAILSVGNAPVRRTNVIAFVYSMAFVAMETSLTFLAVERFGYTARQNGYLLGFLGVCSVLTQGVIARRLLKKADEIRVLRTGLLFSVAGLVLIGTAARPSLLYGGLALLSLGAGLINPSTTGLISLYAGTEEQGRVLGIFRSLGSLSRAITPIAAGVVFWILGSRDLYFAGAALALVAWGMSSRLPQPVK